MISQSDYETLVFICCTRLKIWMGKRGMGEVPFLYSLSKTQCSFERQKELMILLISYYDRNDWGIIIHY